MSLQLLALTFLAMHLLMQSILGGFLDPFADKVLVAVLAVPLAYKGTQYPHTLKGMGGLKSSLPTISWLSSISFE
jgi:predicted permease